jgi:DNA processing protein
MSLTDEHVAAAALAALPGITPKRLRCLLEAFSSASRAVHAVGTGDVREVLARDPDRVERVVSGWRDALDLDAVRAQLTARRAHVWVDGSAAYPIVDAIPDRPGVLLGEGHGPDAFTAPRVGIVGTRSASPQGLADAHELGGFLAAAGVTVVSGLALGIDGAAHEGALDAGGACVGVVATGLDVTYPRRHAALYDRVRASGLVVSEHWYGVRPDRSRFPVRNRIIAALSDVVVVVEATVTGGARITAEFAAAYGRPVFAMPGSRRNPAAVGANALLADGALALLDPGDVLLQLGQGRVGGEWTPPTAPADRDEQRLLDAFGGDAATVDQLVSRSGISAARVAAALHRLELAGRAVRSRGRWWPR